VLNGDPGNPPQTGTAPQFSAHIYCAKTAAWIKMPLGMKVGLGPGHIVLDGDQAQKGDTAPNFRPMFAVENGWMDQDATWYDGRPRPSNYVRCGPSFTPKGHSPPPISVHVCCGQTAGWIKMPLGTKVGLGPGRIVLHGDPAPSPKRGAADNFRPVSIVAKRSPISATAEHLSLLPARR